MLKLFATIFVINICLLTVAPAIQFFVPKETCEEICMEEMSCSEEEGTCGEEDGSKGCCPINACNPFQLCNGCVTILGENNDIQFGIYSTGTINRLISDSKTLSGFRDDCWQPPKAV